MAVNHIWTAVSSVWVSCMSNPSYEYVTSHCRPWLTTYESHILLICLSYYMQSVKHPTTAKFCPRKYSELYTVFDCHLGTCDFRFPLGSRLILHSSELLMGLIHCPDMSVMTYHYSLCPEQRSSHHLGSYPNLFAKMPFQWPPETDRFYFNLYSIHFHNDPHYLNHILNFTKINLLKRGNWFFHLQCQPRISRSGYLNHLLWTKTETDQYICYGYVTKHHKRAQSGTMPLQTMWCTDGNANTLKPLSIVSEHTIKKQ